MKRFVALLLFFLAIPAISQGQAGFSKLAPTTMMQGSTQNLCPPNNFNGIAYAFTNNCAAMYDDWTSWTWIGSNGGSLNKGVLEFGGGHVDYFGNELYWLDPNTGVKTRLTQPSDPTPNLNANCTTRVDPYADGRPSARHSYGAFTHLSSVNKVMIYSGITSAGLAGCGDAKIFYLDESSIASTACAPNCGPVWTQPTLTGTGCSASLSQNWAYISDNPADGNAYIFLPADNSNSAAVDRLDPRTGICTVLARGGTNASQYWGTVVDPVHKVFAIIGDNTDLTGGTYKGVMWCDIATNCATLFRTPLNASCNAISNGVVPTLMYDVTHQQITAYPNNGNALYVVTINKGANTVACTSETYGSTAGVDYPEAFNCVGCKNDPAVTGNHPPMLRKVLYDESQDRYIFDMNPDKAAWTLKRNPMAAVTNPSGGTLTNAPLSVSEAFAQGDIPQFPQAVIGGTPLATQADVKNRWPDGSVKFAVVSFVNPSIAAGATQPVSFINQSSGNNTGFLVKADMLTAPYNFDMQIQETGTASNTISARAMLNATTSIADPGSDPSSAQNGICRYWLKGPIVTAIICDDRSGRTFDFNSDAGSGNPLHPIFECWFYPQNNNVDCNASVENVWSSSTLANSMRDQTYAFTLTGGNTAPTTLFTQASFSHIGRSRWMKDYCINGALVGTANGCSPITVDHNTPYEAYSRVLPNFDPTINLAPSQITNQAAAWTNASQAIQGSATGCDANLGGAGQFCKNMNATGTSPWYGLLNTWETIYWFSRNDPGMLASVLGNTQVAGRIPMHYREWDNAVSATNIFYDAGGTVLPKGRTFSVNARPQENIGVGPGNTNNPGNGFNDTCSGSNARTYTFGSISDDGWTSNGMDPSHWLQVGLTAYLITGKFYYLEETEYAGAYMTGWGGGCPGGRRAGALGIFSQSQPGRGDAWSIRAASHAWLVAPDGSPEKAYFLDKLTNTTIFFEGQQGIANTDATRASSYTVGVNTRDAAGPSPLHFWNSGNIVFVEGPLDTTAGHLSSAWSPWEEAYLFSVFGTSRDYGLPNFDTLLSWGSNRMLHSALDPNAGGIFMIGLYRNPTKLAATNNWVQNYAIDYQQAFTLGNGAGIYTGPSWDSMLNTMHSCNYSPEADNWHGYPLLELAMLYPYTADGLNGQKAYDAARVSLYDTTNGCMPNMFNNPAVFNLASPKLDILPRRAISGTGTPTDIFLAQVAAGAGTGDDCTTAKAVSFFNASGNWGTTAGQIGSGVTVHLCGTITSTLIAPASQGTGLITLRLEPGAALQQPAALSLIQITNKTNSYLISGSAPCGFINHVAIACTEKIQNTANGSPSGFANTATNVVGLDFSGTTGSKTVQWLELGPLYQHTDPNDSAFTDGAKLARGIADDVMMGNLTMQQMVIHDTSWALAPNPRQASAANPPVFTVANVEFYNNDHDIALGSACNPSCWSVSIHDNHSHAHTNWNTFSNAYHHDGIHTFGEQRQASSVTVYNNLFDGPWDWNSTDPIFDQSALQNFSLFNNVFICTVTCTGSPAALRQYGGGPNSFQANNTFIQSGVPRTGTVLYVTVTAGGSGYTSSPTVTVAGSATATAAISGGAVTQLTVTNPGTGYQFPPAVSFSGGGGSGATATASIGFSNATGFELTVPGSLPLPSSNVTVMNNIVSGASQCFNFNSQVFAANTATSGLDYNICANYITSGNRAFNWNGTATDFFNAWQTLSGEGIHSQMVGNGLLGADGTPQSGSPAIGSGTNLTSLCVGNLVPLCSDYNGLARPSSGSWNIGAIGNPPAGTPLAALSQTSAAFFNQMTGTTTSLPMFVTLSNNGTAVLTITSLTFTGTNPSNFGQSNSCGSGIAAGTSCLITITFSPSALGPRSATLNVNDNASGSPHSVSLTGNGMKTISGTGTITGTGTVKVQ